MNFNARLKRLEAIVKRPRRRTCALIIYDPSEEQHDFSQIFREADTVIILPDNGRDPASSPPPGSFTVTYR